MRIMFVTPGLRLGGAERWIATLCKYLPETTIEGIYVTQRAYDTVMVQLCRRLGVPLLVPCEPIEPDVIVTWGVPNIRELIGATHVPVIEVSHNAPGSVPQEYWDAACLQATHYAAVSRTAAGVFPAGHPVAVIEHGVDLERLDHHDSDCRAELGLDGKVALFVGRLEPEKHPEQVIEALVHLPSEWMAVLLGDGPMRDECISLARDSRRKVVFLSPREWVGDVYRAADCLVLPSEAEGAGLVILESWACGTPVVTTSFSAARELQAKWGADLLTTVSLPPNARELAGAILFASRHQDAGLAQALVRKVCSAEKMALAWRQYLEMVVESHRAFRAGLPRGSETSIPAAASPPSENTATLLGGTATCE